MALEPRSGHFRVCGMPHDPGHIPKGMTTGGAERAPRSHVLSDEWHSAATDQRKLALAIFVAMRRNDPNAFIQGNPAAGEITIDGHFDLVNVAREIIDILQEVLV